MARALCKLLDIPVDVLLQKAGVALTEKNG